MFRFIIDDTRALLNDLKAWFVSLTRRWQWFRIRQKKRLEEASADLDNVRKSAEAASRMCSACRALIPASARVCPECGESPGRPVSRGASRWLEGLLPGTISVTSGILTANVVLYALSLMAYTNLQQELPSNVRSAAWEVALNGVGANAPRFVMEGEVWRLLTAVFLHGGALHLAFNSMALISVGMFVEQTYGKAKFVFLYVATGIGASLVSCFWRAGTLGPGIGASGALLGMVGLAAVWGWRRGGSIGEGIRSRMMQWVVYVLVLGFLFRFDNAAHIGGLVSGALLGLVISDETRSEGASGVWEILGWAAGLLVIASFILAGMNYNESVRRTLAIWFGM